MKNFKMTWVFLILTLASGWVYCKTTPSTNRVSKFSNDVVNVWETTIVPGKDNKLKMHHHDKDRLLIAQTDGLLKITNDKGETHDLKLEKGEVYFLPKDKSSELHDDKNLTNNSIKVLVIELKNS